METSLDVTYEEENDHLLLEDSEFIGNKVIRAVKSPSKVDFVANTISGEKTEESRNVKKVRSKDRLYTIKMIVDRNVGTDWYNIKTHLNLVPSLECIEKQIANVLNGCNLNTLTLRKLYGLLSICFNVNLLNTQIPNIDKIIRKHLSELKSTDNITTQDVKKNKRIREKKKILIKSLTEFMDGNDTASLKTCAIKIKQYCEENHLNHPSNAKLFILDSNLQDIFPGRDSISRHVSDILAVLKLSNAELENDSLVNSELDQNNIEGDRKRTKLSTSIVQ